MIRLIAAIDSNRGLAKNNQIPWKIPQDVARFRKLTLTHGGRVLVGSTTYTQMGDYFSGHQTYVVSHQDLKLPNGHTLVKDPSSFLKDWREDIWVIGGAGIYASSIKYADELYLTIVSGNFNCDKFFPEYKDFKVNVKEPEITDNGFTFNYQLLTRF
jgi:dihydrofolate reductase